MSSALDELAWTPPAHWTRIKTIDMHTGGELLRVITSGLPHVVESTKFGRYEAVVPEVSGMACYTGQHEFWFDPADPLRTGFIFR